MPLNEEREGNEEESDDGNDEMAALQIGEGCTYYL